MKAILFTIVSGVFFSFLMGKVMAQGAERPNVILIMTDDQGFGDFGFTGNHLVHTPHLDQLKEESTYFDQFYVSPVCAPTRASLMTGRYSLRTGIRDTYNGGAIMATEEITLPEMLKQGGYQTGIFGKWHLGDNYPSRPMDQGFDESVIHLSGGMGQVGDVTTYFKGDRSYFDPVLWHNGRKEAYQGYCTDIFASEAIDFMENSLKSGQEPFFCYLSFNAPHTPLQVPDKYYQKYKDIDPTAGFDSGRGDFPEMTEEDKEAARKVYAMVENIDDNLGKVFDKLRDWGIEENTIVIFMTDNGPQHYRYLSGMRGKKATVYRGGVRTPFLLRYPAKHSGGITISTPGVHMDVMPTLAELCQVTLPSDRTIDGNSLVPLIDGEQVDWADRPLFFYWTRRYPELYQNMAVQQGEFKLVGHADYDATHKDFELFEMGTDPGEHTNINLKNSTKAKMLKGAMDSIYQELIQSPHLLHQPPIVIGSAAENPSILNRNDAGGDRGIWSQEDIYGKWYVNAKPGTYTMKFRFLNPVPEGGQMTLEVGSRVFRMENPSKGEWIVMDNVTLEEMEGDFIPFYTHNGKRIFPFWVEVENNTLSE
ncbi:arylsulfatase [Echinicola rosea]|uniref:Arylsulfatase n=1 Tax=Echinicola rosea TaxID=1807691 RepID=A0ABQ1VCK4_9BACT|nr:arylsulfatase [Echinicola rosea]GGF51879.1 arylsulfatase [Echinicola rosea]